MKKFMSIDHLPFTEIAIASNLLVAAVLDCASVNTVAISTLNIVFPHVLDIVCFTHTLDHIGERIKTPVLDKFMMSLGWTFFKSPMVKLAWITATGLPVTP